MKRANATQKIEYDPRRTEVRSSLAKAIVRLFDEWELDPADRLTLLGLSEDNRSALARYAKGEPLASNRDLLDRAGHILGIHKSLALLYPHNLEIVKRWMSSPNRKFHDARPVDVVRQFGLPGLTMVRGTLDAMRGR